MKHGSKKKLETKQFTSIHFRCNNIIFFIRKLYSTDVTNAYLDWFKDQEAKRFISSANQMQDLETIRGYVASKEKLQNCLFLGIFNYEKNLLIGTIKFEPINFQQKTSELGILIGNSDYRGIGLGKSSLKIAIQHVNKVFDINRFTLGVSKKNIRAINLYKAIGFIATNKFESASLRMQLEINSTFDL